MQSIVHFVGMVRTGDDALAAGDTAFGKVAKLGFGVLPFGVVAPEAAHRASFEEHSCADARTIVQGKALNVENNVSSVHCDTVRKGSIADETVAVLLCCSSTHQVFISGFLADIQGGKERKEEGFLVKSSGRMMFLIWNKSISMKVIHQRF